MTVWAQELAIASSIVPFVAIFMMKFQRNESLDPMSEFAPFTLMTSLTYKSLLACCRGKTLFKPARY